MVRVQDCTYGQFMERIKGKQILCFCAGDNFRKFCEDYSVLSQMEYVVDSYKAGNLFQMDDKKLPIIFLEQITHITDEAVLVLTSVKAADEIVPALDQDSRFQNMALYVPEMFREDKNDLQLRAGVQAIPKVIHYCWFGGRPIPELYRHWMKSWEQYCPDYEIIEWNERNYDVRKNKYVHQAYEMGKWAFVSDYARIDIIHEYGGVYLDTDVELIKNIDEMLMNDGFCGFETSDYVAYGLGFGARKHHAIVSAIKEYYDNLCFVSKDGTLNQVNCPIIQTEIMKKHGLVCNGEFQLVEGMTVYPSKTLCGMSPHSFRIQNHLGDTYAIHHYSGSWIENVQGKQNIISYIKKDRKSVV